MITSTKPKANFMFIYFSKILSVLKNLILLLRDHLYAKRVYLRNPSKVMLAIPSNKHFLTDVIYNFMQRTLAADIDFLLRVYLTCFIPCSDIRN